MKKILLTIALMGGFAIVSQAAEAPTSSKPKSAAKTAVHSSTRRINDVTICRGCSNGNTVCGQGTDGASARAALNFAVKAGC